MYNHFQLGLRYIHYYLNASGRKGHGIHSPFIFQFITKVLNDEKDYPEYKIVEKLRQKLLHDQTVLTIQDLGAGSSVSGSNKRSVSSITRNAVKARKTGQLLFRMVKEYQPKMILELGTSLGITTAYLSLAGPSAKVVTMEGAGEVAALAARDFKSLGLQNVSIVEGNFDAGLPSVIRDLAAVDFAFIDGNHRLQPTLNYFQQLLMKVNNDSVLLFDDIHWSREMEQAWSIIRAHPSVRCSVDLFFTGIVFFKQEFREKLHFTIRF